MPATSVLVIVIRAHYRSLLHVRPSASPDFQKRLPASTAMSVVQTTSSSSEEACLACRNSYNTEFYNLKASPMGKNVCWRKGDACGAASVLRFCVIGFYDESSVDRLDKNSEGFALYCRMRLFRSSLPTRNVV